MKSFLIAIPYVISILIGYQFINYFFRKEEKLDPMLQFFLAGGLGLGISACVIFYDLLFFDFYSNVWTVVANLVILAITSYLVYQANDRKFSLNIKYLNIHSLWPIAILLLALIPWFQLSKVFPHGGWDAWQVWNYKSKFIFLGEHYWKNLFNPEVWQTSPHYPLLLPLINTWGWSLLDFPHIKGPWATALVFTFFTIGLLYASLKPTVKKPLSILFGIMIVTCPFIIKLTTNQYGDILFAYYLLASFYCLVFSQIQRSQAFASLAGIFLGLLSFTKSEGTLSALVVIFLAFPYFLWGNKDLKQLNSRLLKSFLYWSALALLPTILLKIIYSPGNQTFINGLLSQDSPSTFERLKVALFMMGKIPFNNEWNGIWCMVILGFFFSIKKCFRRTIRIIPLFLFMYLFTVGFYYYVNTHFEIVWWVSVTFSRILTAILPTAIFWIFYALWMDTEKAQEE